MTYQRTSLSLGVLMGVECFMLFTPALTGLSQEQEDKKETVYGATIVGVRGGFGARSIRMTIRIQDYTSDEQVQQCLEMIQEGDQRELRRALEKVRGLGRISVTGFVGNELAVIRARDTEHGPLISLLTARNMSFAELQQSGRSRNYPFSFLQLLIDEEGKGQGTVVVAARPSFNKDGTFEIESFGLQPFQIVNVQQD